MLILGIVLIRTIMCGAIDLTGDLNTGVKNEINKLFSATGGEVQCIGRGEEPAVMIPGKYATVYCGINAPQKAEYELKIKSIRGSVSDESTLESWIEFGGDRDWKGTVAPNDEGFKKVLRMKIPENAPRERIIIRLEAYKNGELISTQDLDFIISKPGFVKSAIC